jgi:hypothetical protein
MKPNGKKVRDHRIAINLNHYEHQLLEAYSQLAGIDKSVIARQVLLNRLRTLLLDEQRIALLLPSAGTIQFPLSYSIVPAPQGVAHHA